MNTSYRLSFGHLTIALTLAYALTTIACNKKQSPTPSNAGSSSVKSAPMSAAAGRGTGQNGIGTKLSRTPPLSPRGHISFGLPERGFALIEAKAGAKPLHLDELLGSNGKDSVLTLSSKGPWMALVTTRFGCGEWSCLAVGRGSKDTWSLVKAGGDLVHPEGVAVVRADGAIVVWEGSGKGGHGRDLFVSRKQGEEWSAPQLLTSTSKYKFHGWPNIAPDGSKVVFDCGDEPYAGEGTGICQVDLPSGAVHVLVQARGSGWQKTIKAAHHAAYAPDGSLVFEGDSDGAGEQVWRLRDGRANALGSFHNDNSPCVLPDGRIASLFMGRSGSAGHELKLIAPDGSSPVMLVLGKDLRDIVLSCGQ